MNNASVRSIISLVLLSVFLSACQSAPVRNPADSVSEVTASSDPESTYVSVVNRTNRTRGIDTLWVNMPRAEWDRMQAMEKLLEADARLDDK